MNLDNVSEFLPFIIPIAIAELVLLAYTLWHILTHHNYKHGSRPLWIVISIVGMQFIGPVLYFIFGKEE